jgi:hypothetical protein
VTGAPPNARTWRPAVAWFVLLALGQAAALALIRAGRIVGYQHYDLAGFSGDPLRVAALAVVAAQAVAVLWAAGSHRAGLSAWIRSRFSWFALIIALLVLFALSAMPSLNPARYAAELAFAFAIQIIAILNVVCIARSAPESLLHVWQRLGDRWLGSERGDAPIPGGFFDRSVTYAALWSVAVALVLAVFVYQRIPHLPDEIVYQLQARYFAAGQIALPAPPAPTAFDVDLMYLDDTRWFSMAPPGWPALLAAGAVIGAEWLLNPLLTGLAVLLLHAVLREIYAPRVARAATLLFAVSPWLLFLGMSLMTHVASLVFALLAALGVARARRGGSALATFVAGLAIGVVSLIRPLEGLAVASVLGFWSLAARGRRWRLTPSLTLVAGTVLSAALAAPYNAALTGSATRFPFALYSDRYYAPGANDLGFGPNRGLGWNMFDPFPGHGARDVVVNSVVNSAAINVELFGWLSGSLVLVVAAVALWRLTRADWWMLSVLLVVVGLHAFYWFSGGPDFAGRYWFFAIVPLCALSVTGIRGLGRDAAERARVSLGVAALSFAALLTFVPWRAADKYWHYRRMEPGLARLANAQRMQRALVLVRGQRHPDYHGAAIHNPLDLRGNRTVFVWDRNRAVRAEAVHAYPDRAVWIVDGPSITRRGYELHVGPLPAGSLAPDVPASDELQDLTSRDRAR